MISTGSGLPQTEVILGSFLDKHDMGDFVEMLSYRGYTENIADALAYIRTSVFGGAG